MSQMAVILNMTPQPRYRYRIGMPSPGTWHEVLNSDAEVYGGSNVGNLGGVVAAESPWHGLPWSGEFTLPPLSIVAFRSEQKG